MNGRKVASTMGYSGNRVAEMNGQDIGSHHDIDRMK